MEKREAMQLWQDADRHGRRLPFLGLKKQNSEQGNVLQRNQEQTNQGIGRKGSGEKQLASCHAIQV